MAGVNDSELLAALRVCSGKKKEVRDFQTQASSLLDRALDEFPEYFPADAKPPLEATLPEFAVALAAGYVKQCLSLGHPGDSFESSLGQAKLGDVAFAALCARGDPAATKSLVDYIQGSFLASMLKTRGSHPQQDIVDIVGDLVSHCYQETREWLLAGRPRLVQYSGKSTLKAWLMTVVDSQLIDRRRRTRGRVLANDNHDDESRTIDNVADPRSLQRDSASEQLEVDQSPTQLIRQAMREVAGELLHEHKVAIAKGDISSQYRFFVLRYLHGRAPREIADEMNVSPSRITELSNRVVDRLIQRIHALGQSGVRPTTPLTREQRQMIELCARQILGESPDSPLEAPRAVVPSDSGGVR
jgi:RNA polymerase sigma factor (sigma-70 family)